jgi:hypothetical protein
MISTLNRFFKIELIKLIYNKENLVNNLILKNSCNSKINCKVVKKSLLLVLLKDYPKIIVFIVKKDSMYLVYLNIKAQKMLITKILTIIIIITIIIELNLQMVVLIILVYKQEENHNKRKNQVKEKIYKLI